MQISLPVNNIEMKGEIEMKNEEPGIGRLIARIRHGIYGYVADRLKNHELDVGQFFFLRFILHHEGITQEQTACGILLDKATVSKGIKRLSQLGYVSKEVNPDDKREFKIYVTEKALTVAPEIETIYKEVHDRLYLQLDENQIGQLQSLLQTIYKNFE